VRPPFEQVRETVSGKKEERIAETFLLVTGSMRSGTTLLGEMLYSRNGQGRHPDLAFDNDRIGLVRELARHHRESDAGNTDWLLEDPFRAFEPDRAALCATLGIEPGEQSLDELRASFASRLSAEIIGVTGYAGNPKVIGLKCTHLFQEIDFLRRFFPKVHAVILARDPRDILASNLGRVGLGREYHTAFMVLGTLLGYQRYIARLARKEDVMVVRYEDLVHFPAQTMEKVLAFAGLDPRRYEWRVLEGKKLASNSSFTEKRGDEMQEMHGIDRESIGNFRTFLSPFHQYSVELLMGGYMQQFGYGREIEPTPKLQKAFTSILLPDLLRALDANRISSEALLERLRELKLA